MAIGEQLVEKTMMADSNIKDLTGNLKTTGFGTIDFRGFNIITRRRVRSITDNGWIGTDHPNTASKEWGEKMLKACADYALDFIEEFKKVEL